MNESDEKLRERVRRAWRPAGHGERHSFNTVWAAAEQRHSAARRHYRRFAGAAAVVAAVLIAFNTPAPQDGSPYIEITDLLESTYWSAPSDALLPDREFDIYQDMPVLFESTIPAGGALL